MVSDSAEFYNLSYEYINDCLRAGLVYREFYKDSELEPEDTLMFKITLVPFGNINTPSLGKWVKFFNIYIKYFLLLTEQSFSATTNKILLKVGNKIITNYELKNKILSTLILSKQEINQKNINRAKKQSIDSLIQKN